MSATDAATWAGLVTVAIIEAIVVVPQDIIDRLRLPPSLIGTFAHLLPAILLTIIFIMHIARFAFIKATNKQKIMILAPVQAESVSAKRFVRGFVRPIGNNIQVLIYSGDKRWHPQPTISLDGYSWFAECYFGLPNSTPYEAFKIIAVSGKKINSPVNTIPSGYVRSEIIDVVRTD